MDLGLGLIGFGEFGRLVAHASRSVSGLRLVAVADADPDRQEAARAAGIDRVYERYLELLSQDDVAVVAVATPPWTHHRIGGAVLRSGRHLFLEKPGGLDPREIWDLAEMADRLGLQASVDLVMRHNPLVLLSKLLVDGGCCGQPERIWVNNFAHCERLGPDHWFWDPAKSGGVLVEHGIHFFDWSIWLAGYPRYVWALARTEGREDRVVAFCWTPEGAWATFYHSFRRPERMESCHWGLALSRGYVFLEGWMPVMMRGWFWPYAERVGEFEELMHRDFGGLLHVEVMRLSGDHFQVTWRARQDRWTVYLRCIEAGLRDLVKAVTDPGHKLQVTLEDAAHALQVAAAAREVARSGHLLGWRLALPKTEDVPCR